MSGARYGLLLDGEEMRSRTRPNYNPASARITGTSVIEDLNIHDIDVIFNLFPQEDFFPAQLGKCRCLRRTDCDQRHDRVHVREPQILQEDPDDLC